MSRHKLQRGYSLIEALIVATVLILGAVAIYAFSVKVNAGALAQRESENIAHITNSINQSYVAFANNAPLTTQRAIEENLVPNTLSVVDDQLLTSFGGEVEITENNSGSNRSFTVTYTNVPSRICSQIVSSANELSRYSQINISGANGSKEVARNGVVNHEQVSDACNSARNADISFVFTSQQTASGTGPGNSCVLPTPSVLTENRNCPAGQIGEITVERTASCTGPITPSNLAVWGDWEEIVNTCVNICVPHSPSSEQVTEACGTDYVGTIVRTRTSSCPNGPGNAGDPVWSEWTETNNCVAACKPLDPQKRIIPCDTGWLGTHEQERTSNCPSSTGSPVWGPWQTSNNTCEEPPRCVVPNPSTQITWQNFSRPCADTHTGNIRMRRELVSSASCSSIYAPSPTWTSPIATGREEFIDNPDQVCTAKCTPSTREEWRTEPGPACPTNQSGTTTRERLFTQTSTCSNNVEVWPSQWTSTTQTRNPVSNCRPSPCSTTGGVTWTTGGVSCRAPTIAATTVERGQKIVFEAEITRTNLNKGTATYICNSLPNGGNSFVLDTTVPYTCDGPCVTPAPQIETDQRMGTQTLSCPANQSGAITQHRTETRTRSRSGTCSGTHGSPTWGNWSAWSAWSFGAWSTASNTCVWNAPTCTPPANQVVSEHWTDSRAANCPSSVFDGYLVQHRPHNRYRTRTASCPNPYGAPVWNEGTWGAYIPASDWVTVGNNCTVPACGSFENNARHYLARYPDLLAAFGTNYNAAYSHWNASGYFEGRGSCWGAPAPTCSVPAPQTEANVWYETHNAGCPAGQTGQHIMQRAITDHRNRSASCPNPYGAPVWGGWSGWYRVAEGGWVTTSNTCVAACVPRTSTERRNVSCTGNQSTVSPGSEYRTAYWTCPGPTITSYSGWVRDVAPQCCAAGRQCSIW